MKYATAAFALAGAVAVSASPTPTIHKRADICGQWDSATTGVYTLYQDLWGEDNASSGSQCSGIDSLSGSDIAWHTTWSWEGDSNGVKSYANIVTAFTDEKVSAISSIPTTWKYSYTGTSIVADVSYDLFTSSTSGGSNEYEIMIWLAALGGAGPISSTGSTVATPTIAGSTWKLYSGPNGDTTVYSFVASSEITSFSGDIKDFLAYLVDNESFPSSQYLTSIGAGTEPFTGSDATLTTTQFSLSVN